MPSANENYRKFIANLFMNYFIDTQEERIYDKIHGQFMGIHVAPQAKSNPFTLYIITNCYITVILESMWRF